MPSSSFETVQKGVLKTQRHWGPCPAGLAKAKKTGWALPSEAGNSRRQEGAGGRALQVLTRIGRLQGRF